MSIAVAIPKPGGPEVLTVIERSDREPGPGEVRIRVAFAAVNPTDVGLRRNGGGELAPPWIPGMDAAGQVELVGDGEARLAVGEPVMAVCTPRRTDGGAQSERLVVAAASVVPIPAHATLAQAATLPMNGLTAMSGLEMLGAGAGDTIAVSGGAGLLASYVIALAKDRGCDVIADASPHDTELVRGFGADVVVARSGDFAAAVRAVAPAGVSAVFDTALLNGDALGAIRDGGGLGRERAGAHRLARASAHPRGRRPDRAAPTRRVRPGRCSRGAASHGRRRPTRSAADRVLVVVSREVVNAADWWPVVVVRE
jgi:NADPH:quinone reductase-like Zn-dependent oxidoreductase